MDDDNQPQPDQHLCGVESTMIKPNQITNEMSYSSAGMDEQFVNTIRT